MLDPNLRPALPEDAFDEFEELANDQIHYRGLHAPPASLEVVAVSGGAQEGYEFEYRLGEVQGKAFALPYRGAWFFAPSRVAREHLDGALRDFLAFFDRELAPYYGWTGPSECQRARGRIRPHHAIWPGELWYHGRGPLESNKLLIEMNNPDISDEEYWCDYDPDAGSGKCDAGN
jgi:hypothetical protein